MAKYQLTIKNWSKFNQRSSDYKKPWWFSLSNTLVEDDDFYDFGHGEFKAWIYILSKASQKQAEQIIINSEHAKNAAKISEKELLSSLNKLRAIGCVDWKCWTESGQMLTDSGHYITEQNNTEQNKTIQTVFDFEKIYSIYPRKEGKRKGLECAKREIKTPEDFQSLEISICRYKAHLEANRFEAKYIKHFSTFMSSWRDWLDPDAGSSSISSIPKQNRATIEELEAIAAGGL